MFSWPFVWFCCWFLVTKSYATPGNCLSELLRKVSGETAPPASEPTPDILGLQKIFEPPPPRPSVDLFQSDKIRKLVRELHTTREPTPTHVPTAASKEEGVYDYAVGSTDQVRRPGQVAQATFNLGDNVPGNYAAVPRSLSQLDHELITNSLNNPVNSTFKESAGLELIDAEGKTLYVSPIVTGQEGGVSAQALFSEDLANALRDLKPAGLRFTHTHPPVLGDAQTNGLATQFSPADIRMNKVMREVLDGAGYADVELQVAIVFVEPTTATFQGLSGGAPTLMIKTFIVPRS